MSEAGKSTREAVLAGKQRIVPTDSLRPNSYNPNKQSDFMYQREKSSIEEFGFLDPVTVRTGDARGPFEDGHCEIIDGEHRWRAATDLGLTEITITDLGVVPDHHARALTLALNDLRGESDKVKRAEIVSGLVAEFPDMKMVLPYTEAEFEEFDNIVDFDWDGLDGSGGGGGGGDGEDGSLVTFQIKLRKDQKDVVERAIARAKKEGETKDTGRALELVAADYLGGSGSDGPVEETEEPDGKRQVGDF